MATEYDVIVIGGGPGGYVAAIRAAQLGLKTACVEKRGTLGGTCLNVGCIPSKALLHSSELFEEFLKHGEEHGIGNPRGKLNLRAMMARKEGVVEKLTGGIELLFKKNKIDYIKGHGIIRSKDTVEVEGESYKTKNIIIATGSEVTPLPGLKINEKRVVSSTGALAMNRVPAHLAVIGGGVIGLELGSVWRRLGAEVTVIEFQDRIAPTMDKEVSKQFQRILEKQGMQFMLNSKVTGLERNRGRGIIRLVVEPAAGGKAEKMETDTILVAIGRRPYTAKLGLENVGLKADERGRIPVNEKLQTSVDNIYAIGDVIAGPMLAHKAEEDGIAAAEFIAGHAAHVDWAKVPSVIYTNPEVAAVGQTEEQLKEAGIPYKVGKFPMAANSRARTLGVGDGFVKILAHADYDTILGCHIIAPQAGTLINEISTAMHFGASAEDIGRICHSHPDLNEAIKESALAVHGEAIHI